MTRAIVRLFFLIVLAAAVTFSVVILTSCVSAPPAHEDLKWDFQFVPGQPAKACLSEDDLAKLRTRLDWCDGK